MIGRVVTATEGFHFGIAAESPVDARIVTNLADRALCEAIHWLDAEQLALMRVWRGLDDAPYLDVHHARKQSRAAFGMRASGHFGGEPGALDAHMIRSTLLLFMDDDRTPDAVVIARDIDGKPERRAGLAQAVAQGWPFKVVPAFTDPAVEAWTIAGFTPCNAAEQRRVDALRTELGFSVLAHPERLKAGRKTHKRSVKRVCAVLVDNNAERRAQCHAAKLDMLRADGEACGIVAFLKAVVDAFGPLFTPR
jgi:hypothetical protein